MLNMNMFDINNFSDTAIYNIQSKAASSTQSHCDLLKDK